MGCGQESAGAAEVMARRTAEPGAGAASTKAQFAYALLRDAILERVLAPGYTINQEILAAEMGLSITPLREALRRLEGEGLVGLIHHNIVQVVPLTPREWRELCEVRAQLEPMAASLAAKSASEPQLQALVRLAAQPLARSAKGRALEHRRFHYAVYAASNNQLLEELLVQIWARTHRYREIVLREWDFDQDDRSRHQLLARTLARRDVEGAGEMMKRHLGEVIDAVGEIVLREIGEGEAAAAPRAALRLGLSSRPPYLEGLARTASK